MGNLKREVLETTDGSNELFELQGVFVEGSLWVIEKKADGTTLFRDVVEFGDKFFQVSPAPEVESTLYCIYEQPESPLENSLINLEPWDRKNLKKLLGLIEDQHQALKCLEQAILNRVERGDFDKWADLIEAKINSIT